MTREVKVKACCLICKHYGFKLGWCLIKHDFSHPYTYCNEFEVKESLLI